MQIERVEISRLTGDPANARKHGERNVQSIVESLNRFGQQKPIVVDSSYCVRAGNGTLEAARSLGWTHLDCVVSDLKGTDAIAYAIADNRTAELAEWDTDVLAATLEGLNLEGMLDATGFDEKELDELLKAVGAELDDEIPEDEIPEPPSDPVTKPGDLWLLGDHRLLCGDSTKAEDVARLMGEDLASLVFTDPPYGVGFQSNMRTKTERFAVLRNDDTILTEWIDNAITHSKGWVFVWTTWKVLGEWMLATKPFGEISNIVVWWKHGGGMGDLQHTFATDHEMALVFSRGAPICGKRIGSVWSFNKDAASSYQHPTQKPIALAAEAVEKTTSKGDVVLDCFGGAGFTTLACEHLSRMCRTIELDPAYCDVIIQRWETLTGRKAVLDDTRHENDTESDGATVANQTGVSASTGGKTDKNHRRPKQQPA